MGYFRSSKYYLYLISFLGLSSNIYTSIEELILMLLSTEKGTKRNETKRNEKKKTNKNN
jgi:hypothetical protein